MLHVSAFLKFESPVEAMQGAYFVFVGAFLIWHSSASLSASDLNALLAFKSTIFDPQNIIQTNWSTSTSVCNWIGITCNTRHGRVAAIDLSSMGIVGNIPPQLGNLSFLIHLNVRNNSFHGRLPSDLSHLRRLKHINLLGNDFEGEFPTWLGSLTALRVVNFTDNKFSGPLSGNSLSNFTNLEEIDMSYNSFEGNIPEGLSALPKLKVLAVEFNQLAGPLPRALFNLSSLQIIAFTGNMRLSGYLPPRICDQLPQLQGLFLSWNSFEGEIPSGIGKCSGLRDLSLSYNKFRGYIPNGIGNLTMLKNLRIGGSNLTGGIPSVFGNLYNLEHLVIFSADLTGTVPPGIGNLSKLETIIFDFNRLRGPMPSKLFNISTLRTISAAGNKFSGEIPSTLGLFLPNLEILYLGGNSFTGEILTSISNASRLRVLDIGFNNFSGAIPHSLGNLRSLEILSIPVNNFSHDMRSKELSFITSLVNCRNLTRLWIGGNPLNGFLPQSIGNLSSSLQSIIADSSGIESEIPSSISNLSNLIELNFRSNNLTGLIPITIKQFLKFQWLDLRENQIQGDIPNEICYLSNLSQLGLGHNKLSGVVPSCLGNVTSLRHVLLNSNNLSSSIPASFWSLKDILEVDMSENYLTGSLPDEIGRFKKLVYLDLSNNQFWGKLPSTIGALQELQQLSLENNNVQGSIPESMKDMLQLWYLDLSFNNLEGEIPTSLQTLLDLKYFNVSYNKLRGPIPHRGPFAHFTNLSFLSNQALCGAPWLQPCPSTLQHKSRTNRKIIIVILAAVSLVLALVISIVLMKLKLKEKISAPSQNLVHLEIFERTSFQELRHITNGFSESNLLGSGSFGSVYKGVRTNGMIWAVKVFDMRLEGASKSFNTECELLNCLRHRNLTRLITASTWPGFKALVLEYMPNGSFQKWLHSEHHLLRFRQRLDVMIDVACGLEYLHFDYTTPVVHCDMKPSNILLDQDMVGHICDFGIAQLLGDGEAVVQTNTLATFGYMAPEYGQEGWVSASSDVYSFGIMLMETFTRKKPMDEMFTEKLSLRDYVEGFFSNSMVDQVIDVDLLLPEDGLVERKIAYISSILQLALSCTAHAPQERTNMKDIVAALRKIKLQFIKDLTPKSRYRNNKR